MTIESDFDEMNISDGDGDGTGTFHAGVDDGDGTGTAEEDRGDLVVPGTGTEGDPDLANGNGEGTGEGIGEGDGQGDGDGLDPAFLEDVANGGSPKTVPYARFAEVIEQNKQLMQAIGNVAALHNPAPAAAPAAAPAPAFDVAATIRAKNDALLEGNLEEAARLDQALFEYQTTVVAAKARQEAIEELTASNTKTAADNVISQAFAQYSFLNDQSDDYNEETLEDVLMYRDRYMAKGDSLPVALQKAVDKVCKPLVQDDGQGAAAAAPAAGGRDPTKVVRNARAASQQPARTSDTGIANRETIDTSKLDLENMPEDQYDALPAALKAKLRGDAVRA